MYPDTVYEVTAKYYDPDGRTNLSACNLALLHPSDTILFGWSESSGISSFLGDIDTLNVASTPISNSHEGYQLTWQFSIKDTWPEALNCIDFVVYADDDDGLNSGFDIDDTNASFILGPNPPQDVSASKGTYMDRVRITWNSSTGASHYQVYRAASSGGLKTALSGWITATTYDETSATPGQTYYYWVKAATDSSGSNASNYSSYDTGWKRSDTNPPNPNPMTWANDPDATSTTCVGMVATTATDPEGSSVSYYFDETSGNSGATDSSWQTSRTYEDCGLSSNTRYRYQVKAKDNSGNETAYSSEHPCFTAIEQPAGIAFGTITTASVQARSTNTPSNLAIAASGLSVMDDKGHSSGWKQHNNWWTDGGLTPNTEYKFSAVAKNGDGVETSHSAQYPKYTLANTPSAPSVIDPTQNSLDVVVGTNGNPGHTVFAIRDVTRGTWIQPDGSSGGSEAWQTASHWGVVATGLSPGTTYEFRVKAKNGDGVETELGSIGQGTTSTGPPDTPTGIAASDGAFSGFVRVSWIEVANATHYEIWRAPPEPAGCSDQFELIAQTPAPPYDDNSAAPLKVYWYRVKACNTACSDYSTTDAGHRSGQLGDLLVTSSTPGHAMRWAGDEPCPCSLVGKALEPMTEEFGVILVLLTAH